MEEDLQREHLNRLDMRNSVGPVGMCPRVLRELAFVAGRPLLIIFERSW